MKPVGDFISFSSITCDPTSLGWHISEMNWNTEGLKSSSLFFYIAGENKDSWGKCYSVKHSTREWPKSSNLSLPPSANNPPVQVLGMIVAFLLLTSSQG